MDPENVRTVATTLGTVAVGLVPAWLLYRQNDNSGEREARERRELRESEEGRASQEQIEREARERVASSEAARRRYVRFDEITDKIMVELETISPRSVTVFNGISNEDRAELAQSYADIMLDGDPEVRDAAEQLRGLLNDLLAEAAGNSGPPIGNIYSLAELLRDAARAALTQHGAANKVEREDNVDVGQEPHTP